MSLHAATTEIHVPRACAPQREKPGHCSLEGAARSLHLEKVRVQQQRPSAAKNK